MVKFRVFVCLTSIKILRYKSNQKFHVYMQCKIKTYIKVKYWHVKLKSVITIKSIKYYSFIFTTETILGDSWDEQAYR